MYTYRAKLLRVIDGDTIELRVDCGFRMSFTDNFRLTGINAPERDAVSREGLRALLSGSEKDGWLQIETTKPDKYGRWLVTILDPAGGPSINAQMIAAGFAVAYDGGVR